MKRDCEAVPSTQPDLVAFSVDPLTLAQTNQRTLNWLVTTTGLLHVRDGDACCEAALLLRLWGLLQQVSAVAVSTSAVAGCARTQTESKGGSASKPG